MPSCDYNLNEIKMVIECAIREWSKSYTWQTNETPMTKIKNFDTQTNDYNSIY